MTHDEALAHVGKVVSRAASMWRPIAARLVAVIDERIAHVRYLDEPGGQLRRAYLWQLEPKSRGGNAMSRDLRTDGCCANCGLWAGAPRVADIDRRVYAQRKLDHSVEVLQARIRLYVPNAPERMLNQPKEDLQTQLAELHVLHLDCCQCEDT